MLLAGLGPLAAACEAERIPGTVPDRDAVNLRDAGGLTLDAGATDGVLRPDGTWLLFLQDRYCLHALGVTDYMVWSWYRVQMSPLGPGAEANQTYIRQSMRLCAQDQSPVSAGLITYVPTEVVAALPTHELTGFLLGNRPGGQYLSDELVDNWGVSEDVGPEDPLPDSADDPAVIDQDGDGEPGVTMILGNNFCRIQIVQRTRYRLSGEVVNEHRIEGGQWTEVNKTVLSASVGLCETENHLDPRPDGNRMVLMRVDGQNGAPDLDADDDGEVECVELLSARNTLLEAGIVVKDEPNNTRCR